ncbi:hypothetical protein Hsw_1990 [Hymenobacter swuensis DY53]|uniref:Uncharacterized protein n=1 Tax=Hymenobacter swuensis DY53 TaxID=1227739 RepID=W8F784_9BACT|nr:hypothetical protein Hsw_1990 [Hymenobacter swuensis DY53]
MNMLAEGYTNNVPIAKGTAGIRDKWDLNVLRATEINRLLPQSGLPTTQVTHS